MGRTKKTLPTKEDLLQQFDAGYARWEAHSRGERCNYGASDGRMMNMERGLLQETARQLQDMGVPVPRPIPPEADKNLWVHMEQWEEKGRQLLEQYHKDANYLYLLSMRDSPFLSKQQKNKVCLDTVINYVSSFQEALDKWRDEPATDYSYKWYIRRHVVAPYFDSFQSCADRVRKFIAESQPDTEQMCPSDKADLRMPVFQTENTGQLSFVF